MSEGLIAVIILASCFVLVSLIFVIGFIILEHMRY